MNFSVYSETYLQGIHAREPLAAEFASKCFALQMDSSMPRQVLGPTEALHAFITFIRALDGDSSIIVFGNERFGIGDWTFGDLSATMLRHGRLRLQILILYALIMFSRLQCVECPYGFG